MYIGSTSQVGVNHCINEIVDNAIDEALAGYCTNIHITVEKNGYFTVYDDGRGIPVGVVPKYNKSALELVMTMLHAGGKFGQGAYKVSGGLHGVGASAVNALSEWMRVEVRRDGKLYAQEYKKGKPTTQVEISKTSMAPDLLEPTQSGTTSIFIPDKSIFSTVKTDNRVLSKKIKERAYLVAGLFFHLYDLRDGRQVHYYFDGGLRSLVRHLNKDKQAVNDIPFYIAKTVDDIMVEAAIQYNDSYTETVESFANVIATP